MMSDDRYTIKKATLEEYRKSLYKHSIEEHWNPGVYDPQVFMQINPNGIFVGYYEKDDGEQVPVAWISATQYEESQHGFLGVYVVHPDYRNRGFGLKIFQYAMNSFPPGFNIGLDGVPEQQPNYQKSGFSPFYNITRFGGNPNLLLNNLQNLKSSPDYSCNNNDHRLVCLSSFYNNNNNNDNNNKDESKDMDMDIKGYNWPSLLANWEYENATRMKRTKFWGHWISQPKGISVALIDKQTSNEDNAPKILGFGTIRDAHGGARVGPLYAFNMEQAQIILAKLLAEFTTRFPENTELSINNTVFLDIPDCNSNFVQFVESLGFVPGFSCRRMWTRSLPDNTNPQYIFSNTTFEFA